MNRYRGFEMYSEARKKNLIRKLHRTFFIFETSFWRSSTGRRLVGAFDVFLPGSRFRLRRLVT